ncbi:MAG: efflux RND transporter permease subunit [Pseudomonadota bacterium]|nr:efflux RND transporter permease subunit [Pseudomonadota bacterium]
MKYDLSALGVSRPIFITVINLLVILAGAAAYLGISVRELPDVDRPVVSIRATYTGASPETMDAEVTRIIEGAVARVSGIKQIESSSEENNLRMNAEFRVGVDLDTAATDVREAVNQVIQDLPEDVEQIMIVKADDDAEDIMQLAVYSDTMDQMALSERLEKDIVPQLISVDGVADVRLDGAQDRVMRIELNPVDMARYRIAIDDVVSALRNTQFDVPAGSYESTDQELLVRANASLITPKSVLNTQIAKNLWLKDIAQVFFAPAEAEDFSVLNGRMVIGLGVLRKSGANTIQISTDIQKRVAEINAQGQDYHLVITQDKADYIRGALKEVVATLVIAIVVVLIVIALFLGRIRVTLIPAVTMPISLIGTMAVIWMFGFSINLLTLLAFVLATGLIVDDAIVVLENIQRCRSEGQKNLAAAVVGTRQVFFAVIATTLTLVAVFVPIAFLPGQTGHLFREFGLVLAISVSISSFVALTLCPMMASRLLTDKPAKETALIRMGALIRNAYVKSLAGLLHHGWLGGFAMILILAAGYFGYTSINQELLPKEDRGQIDIFMVGPDGASLSYIDQQAINATRVLAEYQKQGLITDIHSIIGRHDKNKAFISAKLELWGERDITQQALAAKLSQQLKGITGANIRIIQPSSLQQRGGGEGLQIALTGQNYDDIFKAADAFAQKLQQEIPEVEDARVQFDVSQPELRFEINRQAATDLNVPLERISQTLRIMVDQYDLVDLSIDDLAVPVILAPAGGAIKNAHDIMNIYITNSDSELIPLQSLVTLKEQGIAAQLDRYAQRRAIKVDLGIAPQAPIGDIVNQINTMAQSLPDNVGLEFLGEAADLQEANYELLMTFGIALLVVFLVLAAQFESFGLAFIVICTVPFGIAAALTVLVMTGQTLNIYTQIGFVMLIGLMTKNAILLIEFMEQMRSEGHGVLHAVTHGAEVRFRPVMMTVLATIIGAVPLVIAQGAGAEARVAIGWVIVGGLGLSTIITLYLAPLAYYWVVPYVPLKTDADKVLEGQLKDIA